MIEPDPVNCVFRRFSSLFANPVFMNYINIDHSTSPWFLTNQGCALSVDRERTLHLQMIRLTTHVATGATRQFPHLKRFCAEDVLAIRGGATGQLPRVTDFALKMCSMFVICESAVSIMKRLKSDTRNRMVDETCMPACSWSLQKLKRTLTL